MALHEMTEAPFRAMDEFDVFMVLSLIMDTLFGFSFISEISVLEINLLMVLVFFNRMPLVVRSAWTP